MDEQTRMDLVADYHRRARIKVPDREMHVAVHVIVENQIAEGHAPVLRAMARLTSAGLTRHAALHAVGAVLAEHLFDLFRGTSESGDTMAKYDAAVDRLTADSWRRDYGS